MSVEKLRRTVLYLREVYPKIGVEEKGNIYTLKEVRRAIIQEIGTDERCIKGNIKKLIEIGFLKRLNLHQFRDEGMQY